MPSKQQVGLAHHRVSPCLCALYPQVRQRLKLILQQIFIRHVVYVQLQVLHFAVAILQRVLAVRAAAVRLRTRVLDQVKVAYDLDAEHGRSDFDAHCELSKLPIHQLRGHASFVWGHAPRLAWRRWHTCTFSVAHLTIVGGITMGTNAATASSGAATATAEDLAAFAFFFLTVFGMALNAGKPLGRR